MAFEFDLEAARRVFYTEAHQLLEEMESCVLRLEQDPVNSEILNAAFRAAHTIKGSAGIFGFVVITQFVHHLETVLDRVRNNEIGFDATLSTLVLECCDHVLELMEGIEEGLYITEIPAELQAVQDQLIARLQAFLPQNTIKNSLCENNIQSDGVVDESPTEHAKENGFWHISVRLSGTTLSDGFDPYPIFAYMGSFGRVHTVIPVLDALPGFSQYDPEHCYVGFELCFETSKGYADIEDAFEFLTEESIVRIYSHQCKPSEYDSLINSLPEGPQRAKELLEQAGFYRSNELSVSDQTLQTPQEVDASLVIKALATQTKTQTDAVVSVAVAKPKKKTHTKSSSADQLIRVPSDKLDSLINLVGELVIANAGTVEQARHLSDSKMLESTSVVAGLIDEIRDGALGLRMVQIGETFQRFHRVVRDLSMSLGKQVQLDISGEDTELDKSVVEKIGDPLMHLVRNALDHGLETTEDRQLAGKSAVGRLSLHAYHDSGHIVIEVSDDGAGLKQDKILRKAIEKGIVSPEQTLTESEINMLIFAPGFSTADQVTNLSGRGVGMDVVKKNIEALRGTVQVHSKPNAGATFEIRLPLTLAIIDGFSIGVGHGVYVIPLGFVRECLELPSRAIQDDDKTDLHYDLRGEFLPCVRLRQLFNVTGPLPKRENIIVVSFGGVKVGIVADQLYGESQTVIKPLGSLFESNPAISGATILGSGDVALIVDVPKLMQEVSKVSSRQTETWRAA